MKYELIYEDDDIVVVKKDHGLLVIPDRYDENLPHLKGMLTERFGKIFVVHRLDYGTAGVIVFAKNENSHRNLSMQFERSQVKKEYFAICKGLFPYDLTCMLPISEVNYHGKYKINFKSGRRSVTSFYILERLNNRTLLKVVPYTGRAHQIRVHLKALGYPLYQDFLYNNKIEDKRLTLQAYYLAFKHPLKGDLFEFKVDFTNFMKNFLKNS